MVSGDTMGKPSRVDPLGCRFLWADRSAAIFAVRLFRDYGISNDEDVQHRYGAMIVAYYTSGLSDRSLFEFKNLYLYGGLFDVVAVLLEKSLPFDHFLIRHLLSGLIGVAGICRDLGDRAADCRPTRDLSRRRRFAFAVRGSGRCSIRPRTSRSRPR